MREAPLDVLALEPGRSHLIEANAGTGKTHAIANLAVRFVLEGVAIETLLIVTFTNAAADELRARIRHHLKAGLEVLERGTTPPSDPFLAAVAKRHANADAREQAIHRLRIAMLTINEAAVHTIHGFCQQALKEMAFSGGQPFDLTHIDDGELRRQAVRDWWRGQAYKLQGQELADFLDLFPRPDKLQRLLQPLLAPHAPEITPPPPTDEALDQLAKRRQRLLHELAQHWRQHRSELTALLLSPEAPFERRQKNKKIDELKRLLPSLDEALGAEPPSLPEDALLAAIDADSFRFKKNTENRQQPFRQPPFTVAAELRRLGPEIRHARLRHLLHQARQFVRQRLEQQKRQRGWLAFDDMIAQLHDALASSAGQGLAVALAERYPVIMVDEFQDTDPCQYAIFRQIHRAGAGHTLIMIGDPKQAIYAFRGGDVFAYMQAGREADRRWSLTTNWRSTPAMIEAVNTVFSGDNPFVFDQIGYAPSSAPPGGCQALPLLRGNAPLPALVIERLPRGANGQPLRNVHDIQAHEHQAIANRIAELLDDPSVLLGSRRLRAADVAILVRTGDEARRLRQVLLRHGIRASLSGGGSVWQSTEAAGLIQVLAALAQPEDRDLLRQALCVDWIALPLKRIAEIVDNGKIWSRWVEGIREARTSWQRHGFMAGFHRLLHTVVAMHDGAPTRWLQQLEDPERGLTNLLHLAELVQQAGFDADEGRSLLTWMRKQQREARDEEHPVRLETDEELVRIMTIHKSKGLQFPVVFVPSLWSTQASSPPKAPVPQCWHEPDAGSDGWRYCYNPAMSGKDPAWLHADRERLAEEARLAYVALTRAQSHCHLFFDATGTQKKAGRSGFAWVLSGQQWPKDAPFELTNEKLEAALAALEKRPVLEIRSASKPAASAPRRERARQRPPETALHLAHPRRTIRTVWRIMSFTAMTRDVHQPPSAATEDDAELRDFALRYPAGAHVGTFLHALLERIDARKPLHPQLAEWVPSLALRHGLPADQDLDGLTGWLNDVVQTPLSSHGPKLADLPPEHTLREVSFDFSTCNVQAAQLDAVLAGDGRQRPKLEFESFRGIVTGIIDLAFRHDGRYYLADYKSNLLGPRLEDYAPECLEREMLNRRYDLQCLLYAVAWHRHLRHRLADYRYERDFGGVYYLFLRAMRPAHGPRYGIHFVRPPAELIQRLDKDVLGGGS